MHWVHISFIIAINMMRILPSSSLLPPLPFQNQNKNNVDKGFNILEKASKVIPQGSVVKTAKESWKFIWKRMMTELAPQDKTGSYSRPSYSFQGQLGSVEFPDEGGRYHVYVGNPWYVCNNLFYFKYLISMLWILHYVSHHVYTIL